MSRRMSCSLTVAAVENQTKTVTRRHIDTWQTLKPGDRLTLVEKAMGLKKGEKQRVLAEVEVTDVRVEPIHLITSDIRYGRQECRLEGLPDMSPDKFVTFWLQSHVYGSGLDDDGLPERIDCRRIQWRYLTVVCPKCHNWRDGTVPGHERWSNWDFVPCGHCAGGFVEVAS